jgi:threonine dehydratase
MSRVKIERVEQALKKIDPVFLNSPQYVSESLGKLLGCRLILKIETVNPIRSFKGRGAEWLVSQAKENHLICASAGNFGQAMAYSCRARNKKLTIYASTKANKLKVERMQSLGAEVILFGDDFDAAKLEAKKIAKEKGMRFIEDSFDIETLEGAATMALELLQLPEKIDSFAIALGNGAMFNGIAKVFKERSPQTEMVIVQASGAPAMVESWREGKMISHPQINTIADGIAVRLPVPIALEDMNGLVDDGILVSEDSIIESMKLLHLHAGLVVEPSGAVGIAAILENKMKFEGKTVATVICGSNLTEEQIKKWLA